MTNLHQLNIVVTRPAEKAVTLCELISAQGGQALSVPTIAFASLADSAQFLYAVSKLNEQEWLIFNSPAAVDLSIYAILAAWPELPKTVKFAAVGEGTTNALRKLGYANILHPQTEWSSEALLALPEFQGIGDKKIAIVRGLGGRAWLDKTLAERGAEVLPLIAYERYLPQINTKHVLQLLEQYKIDCIVCTSFAGVNNLKILLGEVAWPYLKMCRLIVVSERIKRLAQDLGFQTIWAARNASDNAIFEGICECLQRFKE